MATNAEIRPTLGRNLSSGANGTVTLPLMAPGTLYGERWSKVDVRFTKIVKIGRTRLQGSLDVFNLLNSSATQLVNTRYEPEWLKPTLILGGRLFRVAAQIDF